MRKMGEWTSRNFDQMLKLTQELRNFASKIKVFFSYIYIRNSLKEHDPATYTFQNI